MADVAQSWGTYTKTIKHQRNYDEVFDFFGGHPS
jgi:DNA-directed RNA polymerase subunit N (RpoN/RPB10)